MNSKAKTFKQHLNESAFIAPETMEVRKWTAKFDKTEHLSDLKKLEAAEAKHLIAIIKMPTIN